MGDNAMKTEEVVILARRHFQECRNTSRPFAGVCLLNAEFLLRHEEREEARLRAIKSLFYSIGDSHPDYQKALKGDS